jgi:sugar lactone lactonase YvrE
MKGTAEKFLETILALIRNDSRQGALGLCPLLEWCCRQPAYWTSTPLKYIACGRALTTAFCLLALSLAAHGQATITSISPTQGPIAGGTTVTLAGSGFTGTTLLLDYVPTTPVSVSDTQVVFITPPHDNGIASVELSGNGLNTYAEFLYIPPPLSSLPPGYITTVMGVGTFEGDGRMATNAMVFPGQGSVTGEDGSVYFSEPNNYVIRRVRPDGIIERYAGTGIAGYTGDSGPALKAQLGHPRGLAIDSAGDIFVADSFLTNSIRRIDATTGIITTIAGGQSAGFSGDGGPASQALLNTPLQLAFDGLGNLYVLDSGNVRIRKIDTNGIITTIAGTGVAGFSGDGGPATQATFNVGVADNGGLAADASGNVYLADTANSRIRRIDAQTGIITTLFANAGRVTGVTTDASGNIYFGVNVIDSSSLRIMKVSPTAQVLQSWGKGAGFSSDGATAATTPFCQIWGIGFDKAGDILFSEDCSSRIRRINISTGTLDTLAGMGPHIIGETGSALATVLTDPGTDLLFLPTGEMLIAEGSNYRVRLFDLQGNVTDFAGNGFLSQVGSYGGPALQAPMYPVALAQKPNGDIIIDNNNLILVESAGDINTLTSCCFGFTGDGGPAAAALVGQPWDVAADSSGDVFIADSNNNRIRKIDALTGFITTVAGSGPTNPQEGYGEGSYCGDGGPATNACLNTPYGIALAPDGTMYIGENGQRIRKVDPSGIITTFFSGGGSRVRLNAAGNIFMTPYRLEPNGHAFQFFATAPGTNGLGDGGPAWAANFGGGLQDSGIAIDSEGNLFFTDSGNRRIRAICYGAVISEPGSTVAATGGAAQSAAEGTQFAGALQVTVDSPAGNLENGIRVDFAAPASGPACAFPNGSSTYSTLTSLDGVASATCVANAQTGSYTVTATPLALGASASFTLTNTAAPDVTLSPGSLTFGTQAVNTSSAGQTVTLANAGAVSLSITSISVSANFGQTNNCGSSVAADGSCTINVTFAPTAVGALEGTLNITDNSGSVAGSTQTVALSGTGTAPSVSLSAPSLSFGSQPLSTASAAQVETITNAGTADLTVSAVTIGGMNASDFATTADTCTGATVTPNSTCTVGVTFTPAATGMRSGTLIFTDNNDGVAGSTQTVSLSGTGTGPVVSLSSALTFSTQLVGTTSSSQTVTLTNTGNGSLTFSAIAVAAPFAIATSGTTCSTSTIVAAAGTCTVAVTFTPTASGAASGSLSFSDNAPNSPQTLALSGTAQDFSFAPPSGSSATATVAPGATANYTLSVGGMGGFSGTVSFTCAGAPSEATCLVSPNPVTAGSTATNVTVTVTTTAPSLSAPRSRPLPPVPPLSPGVRGPWILALALVTMAWAIRRRNQPDLGRWRSTMLRFSTGFLLLFVLAVCGGGGGGGPTGPTPNPGTPAGTYNLTVTGTTGSGSSAMSHNVTLTLTVS